MKITKIEIKDFQQFKDFSIDLTYPKGHEKAGKPLDKVCFIGQSGTGKSTILEQIQDSIEGFAEVVENNDEPIFYSYTKTEKNNFILSHYDKTDNETIDVYFNKEQLTEKGEVTFNDFKNFIKKTDKILLYLDESISEYYQDVKASLNKIGIVTEKDIDEKRKKINDIFSKYKNTKIVDSRSVFFPEASDEFLFYLLYKLIIYDEKLVKRNSKFVSQVNDKNFKQLHKELNDWKESNPNQRTIFAEEVNFFLNKFHVKVDNEIPWGGGIKVIRTDDTEFPFKFASTGTKRIMLTTLLLFFLDTKNTIILFDEPENSLYPDVQQELITFYTQLASDAQFFFATHSPIIASQFEACERFILKFDDKGFVKAVRGDAPEGVEPNFILLNDFGLKTVLIPKGEEKWKEFVELKSKIHFEKDEKIKQELMDKYMEIGIKYNFGNYEKNSKK